MGLFTRKKNDEIYDCVKNQELNNYNDSEKESDVEQEENEWILVEGFKGTNKDMICRDTQYEINKKYTYEGKIELCESGYHFCKRLKNVFGYYSIDNGNRFFKVKCLVSKKEWESVNDKFTAKEITFTEELGYKELESFIINKYPFIKNEADWNDINELGIEKFYRKYYMSIMLDAEYGETFSNILYDDINNKIKEAENEKRKQFMQLSSYSGRYFTNDYITNQQQLYPYTPSYDYSRFDRLISKVRAFKEEGLSKDMSVYLLLQN